MAQGTPNVANRTDAVPRSAECRAIQRGGSDRRWACVLPSEPEAEISKLWECAEVGSSAQSQGGRRSSKQPEKSRRLYGCRCTIRCLWRSRNTG